ncbi:MAG TPA: AMP-binding protein, partial [Gaiellaceae bacterium]|nr:AMP-binding protein [Gaiellaceae bacterium]
MAVNAIVKSASKLEVTPNLLDYDAGLAPGFWERASEELDGLPGDGGLNIAYEAVDRHAFGARADHLALRCLGKRGQVHDFTYAELGRETSRFANALRSLGVEKGDLVGALAGRIPELYVAALGTLKNR